MVVLGGILDGFGQLDPAETGVAYLLVFTLVFGDGIVPVLPGETTIIAASTLAASGELNIVGVFLAAWAGAVAGDSVVYFVGRLGSGPIYHWLERVVSADRITSAQRFLRRMGGALIVFGRFVPGLRLATALVSGVLPVPAKRYYRYEVLGGGLWALYVTLIGFYLGKEFQGHMWASLVVAGIVTTAIGLTIGYIYHRIERADREREQERER